MAGDRWSDTSAAPAEAGNDAPAPGSVVGLMIAQRAGPPAAPGTATRAATLQEWQGEPGGLTVIADVTADPATVEAASGRNVWGSFSTPSDALIVVAAIARERPGSTGRLELTGVRMLAYEPRRRSARASLNRPVRLLSGGSAHEATMLDLSRGGCRIFTREPGDPRNPGSPGNLAEGYALAVQLKLDDGQVLEADALVIRADGPEVALRFTGLAASDAAEVDATVFRELVRVEG
jgi:hypothetical protein